MTEPSAAAKRLATYAMLGASLESADKPRLYVAGPMTGLPEFNFPAFNAAEGSLRLRGHDVRNPARHGAGAPDATWADYMRRDIADLLECDGVALLPGWERSRGATLEEHIAQTLGLEVAPLDQWLFTAQR